MPKHKPELIELLINEAVNDQQVNNPDNYVEVVNRARPQGFAEHFALILEDTPQAHSTLKPEFFLHFFLGSILTLPSTSLMSKLNIEDISFLLGKDTLKLVFKIHEQEHYKLKFIIINTSSRSDSENIGFSREELAEIKSELLGSSSIATTEMDGQILHITRDTGFKLKILPELSHKEFTTIPSLNSNIDNTFHKVKKDTGQDFDPLLAKLSNNEISSVHKNTEDTFVLLNKIYKSYSSKVLGQSESSYHGYSYGFFRLNYKYKYALDCYVERIAGKGYIDLVLLSRNNDKGNNNQQPDDVATSHKHQNAAPKDKKEFIPIIVELKAGTGALKAIEQMHESGYIYNLPNIRTNAKEAVIVGVDFSAADDLKVQNLQIKAAAQNLISKLAEDVFNNKDTAQKIVKDIHGAIEYLYYSSIKSKDHHYLSRVLLGQAFTSKDNSNGNKGQLNKHVFLYNKDRKLNLIGDRVTTIILQQDSEGIILNIIEGSNTHQTRFKSKKQEKIFDDSKILPVENLAIQDLTIINIAVNPEAKIFSGQIGKSYVTREDIKVEQKNINEFRDHHKYQGQFQSIRTVKAQELIDLINNQDLSVDSDNYRPPDKKQKVLGKDFQEVLLECLSPVREFINKESDLQAIIQGMFINQELIGGKQIKVFSEVSCGSGRVDLALSIVDKDFQEDKPILMELKYGSNIGLLTDSEKQLSTYSQYLKSATTHKEVQNIAIIYHTNKANNFLQVKISSKKIDHTSQSSDNAQDSSAKVSVSTRVKKVFKITDFKFLSQIKTIDNDVFLDCSYGTNNKSLSKQDFAEVIEFLEKVSVSSSAKITLSLAGNDINNEQATKLFWVLEKNIAINSLGISSTNLNKELLEQLIAALKKKENFIISEPLSPADNLLILKDFVNDLSIDNSIAQVYQQQARQLLDELKAVEHFPIGSKEQNQHLAKIRQLFPDLIRIQGAINISSSKLEKGHDLLNKIQAIENMPISSEERNQNLVKMFIKQPQKVRFSSLQKLDMSNNKLGPEIAPILKDALETLNGLEEINLSNNPIGNKGLESIAQGLKLNYSIKILILSNIGITKINELSKILSQKKALIVLDLSGNNNLSNAELAVFLDDLAKAKAIQKLNLSNLDLSDDNTLKSLANFISTSKSLQELNLSNTNLGNKGLELITPALCNNNLNLFLDLSDNKISNADILFKSLNPDYYDNVLTGLVLANNAISEVTKLSDALIGNKKLQYLDLSNNQITFKEASYIFFSLHHLDEDATAQNDILSTLILSNNPIRIDPKDQDGFKDFQMMLSHNDGLTHLALSNLAIDDSLLTRILDNLQENTRLESIDLSYNKIEIIDPKAQARIREFLRENKFLSELNLANNKITDQGGKIIISSFLQKEIINNKLAKRVEFMDLDLSGNPSLGKEFINQLIHIIKGEYPIENLRLANNNWPLEYTTKLISAIVSNKERKVNIDLSGNKINSQSQKLLNDYRAAINLQILDEDLQHSIIATCLPGTSKGKRSINECKVGWSDIDEISISKTRNSKEIVIDSKKFLAYSKKNIGDEQKSWQLVRLAQEIQNKGDKKIVGEYKELFDKVIEAEGYKNYIQQERINYLGVHIINRDSDNISPKLKLKLLNAAGKMQLMHGIYGSLITCKDGEAESCALSVGGLGYAFLSQPIEKVMIKITPKIVNNAAHIGGKVIPRILNYDAKFIVQLAGAKYGAKVAKGIAGALGGAFDIIDIAMSSNMLVECNKRASSNNTCSDKEIRDNIASISLSSISFVSGIALAAMGSGPVGIAFGFTLIIIQGVYSGISNIIEYEEKYDTTHKENWSIFWRTALLRSMAEDVANLKTRHDAVNHTVKNAWNMLERFPEEIVAYAIGLGKIELSYTPLCETVIHYYPVFCIGRRPQEGPCKDGGSGVIAQNVTECTIRSQYIPHLRPAYSRIDMQKQDIKYTKNLSRVLPDPVVNATMICLPKITDAIYEKGITSSRSDAIYECDNAVVMVCNQRQYSQVKDKYIIYDLKNVNSGTIIGSNTLNNIFQIFEGDPVIFGSTALDNRFVILADKYHGKIYLGGNSTNIIDVSQLQNQHISMEYTYIYPLTINMSITIDDNIMSQVDSRTQDVEIRYIGRKYKGDKIVCKYLSHQEDGNIIQDNIVGHNTIIIDSGGGGDYYDQDQIWNCNKVIVSPNTVVRGSNGNYTFYITSQNYLANYSAIYHISDIDIVGRGTINFPEISLLKDCNQINYSVVDNILSFFIPLNGNGTYLLRLKNYLNKDNDTNYVLIDKYGSNIVYQYTTYNNRQIMEHFALYAECRFDTTQKVVNHYRNISYSDKNRAVFGTVKNNQYNNLLKFGSSGNDVIISDKDVVFMEGSKGNDIYIVNNDSFYILNINNKAQDLKLDILNILCVNNILNILLVKNTNDLHLLFNSTEDNAHQNTPKEIIIDNYFLDYTYQHIALMDKDGNSFIPFFMLGQDVVLVPFYHAGLVKNIYMLSANSYEQEVIDIEISNIMFCRQDNNLLLVEKEVQGLNSLSIILKDYYLQKQQWSGIKLYSYNNGDYNRVDLNNVELSTMHYQNEYDSIIQEYTVNFAEGSQEITHNQRNINSQLVSIEPNQEKIGIVILQNTTPESLEVTFHKDDLILTDNRYNNQLVIKNWYKDNKYIISVLEFDSGIEQIRIHVYNKDYGHILNKLIDRIKLNSEIANINADVVDTVQEESYNKHRHHHGEAHNRGRRDVDKADFSMEHDSQSLYSASGAASSKPMPTVYNAVKWVGDGIRTILYYLNPVEQINPWFNKDESRVDEQVIDITNKSEQSNNQLEDNKVKAKSALRKLQQKVTIPEEQYRNEEGQYKKYEGVTLYSSSKISNRFIGNEASIGDVVNYDLLGMQGNLLLLDLLVRKKNGVKYNNGVVIKNNIGDEYAQSLAYSAYILPSNMSYINNDTEDVGLLG